MQTVPHNSPGTLVFWCQRSCWYSNGSTPNESAKYISIGRQVCWLRHFTA